MGKRQLRWMRLDNAAKIFPAARRRGWSNIFRLSITLDSPVDPEILQQALDCTAARFPSIAVRLRVAAFWYYLEEVEKPPQVQSEKAYPLTHMPFDDIRRCAFRVLYYENRIAVEFFHAVTDGSGGLIFLKTLAAEYLERCCGEKIPCTDGVLDRSEEPREEELCDDFLRYAADFGIKKREATAFQLAGTPEQGGYKNVIVGKVSTADMLRVARAYGATVTELCAAVMIDSFQTLQRRRLSLYGPSRRRPRPIKVMIPTNLRRLFDSQTLRNFSLYVTPGIDTALGEYSFEEIIAEVKNEMALELTQKKMAARISANVAMEKNPLLKILPLFVKNIGMKIAYDLTGEKKTCITISNLGAVKLPPQMAKHTKSVGFMLGTQTTSPNNCAIISYGEELYISIIRSIKEPALEREFFTRLVRLGIGVRIKSNRRRGKEECIV